MLLSILIATSAFTQIEKARGTVNGHEHWIIDEFQKESLSKYLKETGLDKKYDDRIIDDALLGYSRESKLAECADKLDRYYLLKKVVTDNSVYDFKELYDFKEIHDKLRPDNEMSYNNERRLAFIKSLMPHYDEHALYAAMQEKSEVEKLTGETALILYINDKDSRFSPKGFNFLDGSSDIANKYFLNRNKKLSPAAALNAVAKSHPKDMDELRQYAKTVFKSDNLSDELVQRLINTWLEIAYWDDMKETVMNNCRTLYKVYENALPGCKDIIIHELDEGASGRAFAITDPKSKKTCNNAETQAFSQMTGSWKSYALKLTITGSCNEASGTMEWVEWCYSIDDKISNYPHYPGTFTGSMDGEALSLKWTMAAKGPHPKQDGTAYVHVGKEGTITLSGFGCGNGVLNKE